MPLVNPGRGHLKQPPLAARSAPARLLRQHRERSELIQQAELALGLATLGNFAGVHINSALEEASMEVGGERTRVSERVAGPFIFATGYMREELARALVPLARIGLVDCVGRTVGRRLHVFIPQNEFANRLIEREDIDAGTRGIHELRGRPIEHVARDNLLRSRGEDVLDLFALAGGTLLNGEDSAERTVYVGVRRPVDRIVEYAVAIAADLD